MSEGEELIFI